MAPTGNGLNVIALISGGKDSFLSILQCQKLGHEIVALANLYPPKSDTSHDEDLNSHLYQTAGHAVIPFYEQALGLPLYRREINGNASRLEREYDASYLSSNHDKVHDETEDLFNLLQDILNKHPHANAVCSGAILSNYQRTRIEDICLRLNLTSLAYLWEMCLPLPFISDDSSTSERATALLDYFATAELDARIVKVASGGLDESYLWQSLSDARVRQRIKNAMRRFGGSVVGEGGEFETLVVSGPSSLFKGRIVVDTDACQVRRGQGGEAWLDIDTTKIHIERSYASEVSADHHKASDEDPVPLPQPSLRDPIIIEKLSSIPSEQLAQGHNSVFRTLKAKVTKCGGLLCFENIYSGIEANSCRHEMELIVEEVRRLLLLKSMEPASLVFVTIILRNMDDFQDVNMVWKTLFSRPLPPARVTIAAGSQLPSNIRVLLSCIACKRNQNRKSGLHVQSISHWAPANIGPYSQAVSIPVGVEDNAAKVVFIAGQIPLVPETMLPAAFQDNDKAEESRCQAMLSLRHARRIGSVLSVCWFGYAIAFVCSDDKLSARERASIAYSVWKETHEQLFVEQDQEDQSDGPDAWDLEFGAQRRFTAVPDENQPVPSPKALRTSHSESQTPGFLAVHMDSLPRNQTIEWQTIGFAAGLVDVKQENNFMTKCELYDSNGINCYASATVIAVPQKHKQDLLSEISERKGLTTIYGSTTNLLEQHASDALVPCHRVWGLVNKELVELSHGIVVQWYGDGA